MGWALYAVFHSIPAGQPAEDVSFPADYIVVAMRLFGGIATVSGLFVGVGVGVGVGAGVRAKTTEVESGR